MDSHRIHAMMLRLLLVSLVFSAVVYLSSAPAPAQPAGAPQIQELSWPQRFDVRGFQVSTFGFAVTQSGPIVLDVKFQGAPLDVILQGPIAQPLEQQGSGALRINYVVTTQDVQRGVFWHVLLRLTPAAAQAGAQSAGSIAVQHPQANPAVVQQAAQALMAQRHIPTAQERAQSAGSVRAQRDAMFSARLAAGEQELVQRRAVIMRNLQPTIDAMQREKAGMAQPGAPGQPAAGVNTRGLASYQLQRPAPPHPLITSLSAAEGVPGDGILILGSGFGTTDGEVHFVIGPDPSLDKVSPPGVWVNNQIFAAVPDPSAADPSVGAMAYNGVVYVVVGGVKSNLIPFRFDPIIDHRVIRIPADYLLGNFGMVTVDNKYHDITRLNYNYISGASGDDQFYRYTLLQNGWTVEALPVAYNCDPKAAGGGISSVTARVGTPSPFTDVSSWVDTVYVDWGVYCYDIEIPIQGPRGLPDGVVCVNKPQQGSACPNTQ